ncbi:MAG: hypothetical protein LBO66_06090 [Deltaproteobacteria bacterium]|nr:hypothetical protein [Deltaproteobacteria bacterium]
MKFFFLSLLASLFLPLASTGAYAHKECLAGPNNAVVCPKEPEGGIALNQSGQFACGVGACVRNRHGAVQCSSVPGGGAGIATNGLVKCEGNCVAGQANLCVTLR